MTGKHLTRKDGLQGQKLQAESWLHEDEIAWIENQDVCALHGYLQAHSLRHAKRTKYGRVNLVLACKEVISRLEALGFDVDGDPLADSVGEGRR